MKSQNLILPFLATPFALGAQQAVHPVATAASVNRPNILVILTDDLGYGDVHCLNLERGKIPTPNLDKLAAQGMVFTEAHASASVCTPSRYGILTGRYNWRSYLQSDVLADNKPPLITDGRPTIASMLKQQGYYTAVIGKWHVGFSLEEPYKNLPGLRDGAPMGAVTKNGPLTRGFDEFFGFDRLSDAPTSMFEKDRVTRRIKPIDLLPEFVNRANDTIATRAKTGQPFFMYLALNSPHAPIVPNKDWQGKSGLSPYADFVMETDWAVGEVLATLEKQGVADNTLIFFTSDNGCTTGLGIARKLEAKGHYPSADRRGYKSDAWDGGHHIPLIVRWPGKVKPGSRCSQLVCLNDFMATCADITGVNVPENAAVDSVSLLPLLRGEDKTVRETLVHHSIRGNFAIRDGKWKLILCSGSGGWDPPTNEAAKKQGLPTVQLYDMTQDIGERKNLQAEHPEIVKRLTEKLEKLVADGRSTPGPKQTNDVPVDIFKKGK